MYYRKTSYPESGHADVPDDLWMEFQRIREHLSGVDQNNVAPDTIGRDLVVPPWDKDHNGPSDIVDVDGNFLYKEEVRPVTDPIKLLENAQDGDWHDLSQNGLVLRTVSRGDSPWIVGASVSAVVENPILINEATRGDHLDDTLTRAELLGEVARATWQFRAPDFGGEGVFGSEFEQEQRGNLHMRITSSQGGLSAAEAVGGVNSYIHGCSIATVACFFVRGGPVEFSPSLLFRSQLNETDWKLAVTNANIFAFGLSR